MFGKEKDESLKVHWQPFINIDGVDLSRVLKRAANLLYFIVKNHSFLMEKTKRRLLFLYFLIE